MDRLKHTTDRALMERLRAGEAAAFEELYERHFARVYGFLRARMPDRMEAEDVAQEIFLEVFRSADGYRGSAEVDAWIFGVARNLLRQHIRERKRRSVRDAELRVEEPIEAATPEDELRVSRILEHLSLEISSAEPWQARGFALRYFHGASLQEVARVAERSRYSVRVALHRLRRRALRGLL